MHQRQLIRDAFASILTGLSLTQSRVYKSRVRALNQDLETPGLLIYTRSESSEIYNEAPREYERTVRVAVEILAKAADDLDTVLDNIAEEVEAAIFNNQHLEVDDGQGTMVRRAADSVLTDTEVAIDKEGETLIGGARLTFDVLYYQEAPAGISTLGDPQDLEAVDVDWNPGNQLPPAPDDGDHLKDSIEGLDQ